MGVTMNRKQYAKTLSKLSAMTDSELWQHYAKLNRQSIAKTLEHRCITLSELEKRGVRGLIIDGKLVR
jgi:hypothetical protein